MRRRNIGQTIYKLAISLQAKNKKLKESLDVMTQLCRLKYGNLDEQVFAEILKAEELLK